MSEQDNQPQDRADGPPSVAEHRQHSLSADDTDRHAGLPKPEQQELEQQEVEQQEVEQQELDSQQSAAWQTADEGQIRVDAAAPTPTLPASDDFHQPMDPIKRSPLDSGVLRGMQRDDRDGRGIMDALAGRASVFGFRSDIVVDAISLAADQYLGDATSLDPQPGSSSPLPDVIRQSLGTSSGVQPDAMLLLPSADEAIDHAIGLARRNGGENAFRTIGFVGSDHGRTGMGRSASGRPELSRGLGPMMAGFTHVPAGDLTAVRGAINDQTTAILLSPIDFSRAAEPVEASFLTGLRELCDQHGLLLVIDETRIVWGASGRPFTFTSIADIHADIVIVSAGLFGGLAGGLIIGSEQAMGTARVDTDLAPMAAAVATATVAELIEQRLPESAVDWMRDFAVELAETVGEFQFIRDLNVTGMTIGVQSDIASGELIEAADREGLRVEAAGETGFRLQPPLVMRDDDRQHLLEMLKRTMESVERATASLGV